MPAAKKFIKNAVDNDKPFFVWFNTTHMHFRTHIEDRIRGQSGRWQSEYHDCMIEHDKNIGEMLALLDELGIADNTMVMYSTDNGPHMNSWPDAGMTPFRNEKNSNWEGAFRVPCMVRWPGVVKPGTVCNEIVSHLDWLPTIVDAAGDADVKEKLTKGMKANGKDFKVHLDGFSLLPYLTGKAKQHARKGFFYFTDDGDLACLRFDNWKVVFMEQRVRGTLQDLGRALRGAARAEDLQPAHRSLRARGRHFQHLLRLAARSRVHPCPRAGGRRGVPEDLQGIPAAPEGGQLRRGPGD